jgi:hypothetical protein
MLLGVIVRFLIYKAQPSIRIVTIRLKGAYQTTVITARAILAAPILTIRLIVS